MLKKTIFCIFSVLFICASAWSQTRPDKSSLPTLPHPSQKTNDYIPGEVIVKYRSVFTTTDCNLFNTQVQASAVNKITAQAAFHKHFKTQVKKKNRMKDWELLRLPEGQSVSAAIADMKENALIEYVEPNGRVYAAASSTTFTPNGVFNDPYYTDGSTQWWIDRTQGDEAANAGVFFGGSSDVIVAVLDTGADADHVEFTGRLVAGWNFVSGNSNTDDDNYRLGGPTGTIVNGHGTHAAGAVVAINNNTLGVAGTAWDSRIKVMPVKVLNNFANGNFFDIADGITYAADNGAHIINMSFVTTSHSTAIYAAITNTAGTMKVAAAGNANENMKDTPYYPACYAEVMSVGATDARDMVTFYSNYCDAYDADRLDCVAPGGALENYWPEDPLLYPEDNGLTITARTGGWNAVDGTSFAAPQVAALAALIKLTWPSMTASELRTRILNNCDVVDTGETRYYGQGRINVLSALSGFPTPTITPTATISATYTASPTHSPTATHSPTSTITPTVSPTPTISATYTHSPTVTLTPTASPTSTNSPTATITPTTIPLSFVSDEFQAYPQPGRNFVRVAFRFVGTGTVALELYNTIGERVLRVEEQPQDQGDYAVVEMITRDIRPGVYYLKLKVEDTNGSRVITGKIAIVK